MSKMAKCGMYKYSFCTHKHDAIECATCLLVQRRTNLYKWIDGKKYKKCPHCGKYKPMTEFKANTNGNKSWCHDCHLEYARKRAQRLKTEEMPIVKVTAIAKGNMFCKSQELTTKEFKTFCKQFLEEIETKTAFIISKL